MSDTHSGHRNLYAHNSSHFKRLSITTRKIVGKQRAKLLQISKKSHCGFDVYLAKYYQLLIQLTFFKLRPLSQKT